MAGLPDYVAKNIAHWEKWAHAWVEAGERNWAGEPVWGMWGIPDRELRLLPDDMTGMRAVELGCGTGYVSGWMIRRGAQVVGIDTSAKQLATARRLAAEHGVTLELIHGNAEAIPYPDGHFDFAVSEYGVAVWADPYVWVPEAGRILRRGGELVVLGHHPIAMITQDFTANEPSTQTLMHPYFGMHRIDWDDGEDRGTEFCLPTSDWFRLFDDVGFDVVAYRELQAPEPGPEVNFFVTAQWAHEYPSEAVWKVRKR